jgi:hypothetical protein
MSADLATLDYVPGLDFKGPFEELTELRALLTTQEIADLTGLRRETISRARPDRRFRRRTEKALGDLYLVVTRMRAVAEIDAGHLAAVLRRPQAALGDRSIAELLREGKIDVVLEHLTDSDSGLDHARPQPRADGDREAAAVAAVREREMKRVEAFLAADPEMAALLPEIERRLRRSFAPVKWIERGVSVEYGGEGDDVLYVWAHSDLSFAEKEERFLAFLDRERDFLRPVRSRLNLAAL